MGKSADREPRDSFSVRVRLDWTELLEDVSLPISNEMPPGSRMPNANIM